MNPVTVIRRVVVCARVAWGHAIGTASAEETALDVSQIFSERPSMVHKGALLQGCIASLDLGDMNPLDGSRQINSVEIHGEGEDRIVLFLTGNLEGDVTQGQCVVFRLDDELGFMTFGGAYQGYGHAAVAPTVSYTPRTAPDIDAKATPRSMTMDELFAGALRAPAPGLSLSGTLASVDENGSDVILTLASEAGCTGIAYYSFSDINASQQQTQVIRSLKAGDVVTLSVNTSMLMECMAVFRVNAIEDVAPPRG